MSDPPIYYNALPDFRQCCFRHIGNHFELANPGDPEQGPARAGYNRANAARACKGGVTRECIDLVYSDAGYNRANAARACGGQE